MRVEQVLIGCPTRGAVSVSTIAAFEAERALNPGLTSVAYGTNHLSVFRNREEICEFFLAGTWEALIMVDDDTQPSRNIVELVSNLDVMGDYDICGAAYPVFQPLLAPLPIVAAYEYIAATEDWRPYGDCWERRGLHECDAVGFGCVAIHRRVLEAIPQPWFEEKVLNDHWLSDDMAFCLKAKQAGFKIGIDYDKICEHTKTVELMALMEGVFAILEDVVKPGSNAARDLIRSRNGIVAAADAGEAMQKPDEVDALLDIARDTHVAVELGTGGGGLALALAATGKRVLSVDIGAQPDLGGVETLRGDSHAISTLDAVRIWGAGEIDLLIIDGDHSYEGTRKDWDDYMPLVKPGGMVALHDISQQEGAEWGDGPVRLWAEIRQDREHAEIASLANTAPWGGWGLLWMR